MSTTTQIDQPNEKSFRLEESFQKMLYLLNDKDLCEEYCTFLESVGAQDCFTLWKLIESFELDYLIDEKDAEKSAKRIVHRYLRAGSKHQIKLSNHRLVQELCNGLDEEGLSIDIQKIAKLMRSTKQMLFELLQKLFDEFTLRRSMDVEQKHDGEVDW